MSGYLLVHGAWSGGWIWDDVVPRLEKAGHDVTVVEQLASAGTDPASLCDLTADAAHVRQVPDAVDGPVVLVGDSYGGTVITEMVDHRNVRHSVDLAAFWPRRGQSRFDLQKSEAWRHAKATPAVRGGTAVLPGTCVPRTSDGAPQAGLSRRGQTEGRSQGSAAQAGEE